MRSFNRYDVRLLMARNNRMLRIGLILILSFALSLCVPISVGADRGRVEVQVMGHYTDDEEWFGEEWTFEVSARDVPDFDDRDWVNLVPKNIWSGDSSPDNNDWHNLDDRVLFNRRYRGQLPNGIQVRQWGWENDTGARRIYNCCKWWRNDDDSYGTGTESINLDDLDNDIWKVYDWPTLKGSHGLKVKAKVVRAPEIVMVCPDFGCRAQQDRLILVVGQNFVSGMTLAITGLGVTVHDVEVDSPNVIIARVDIGALAALTDRDVRVVNPELLGMPAVLSNGYSILRRTQCGGPQ